jgi:hypothetical protein
MKKKQPRQTPRRKPIRKNSGRAARERELALERWMAINVDEPVEMASVPDYPPMLDYGLDENLNEGREWLAGGDWRGKQIGGGA